jgi:dTDP-4-dehydrorhamnose reductase
MKVLVTGADGQVARAVLASAPPGASVVGRAHRELDITSLDAVLACVREARPDVIVNAAAYTAVDRAETEPTIAAAANAGGPQHLARAASELGARFVHLSTDFVFDGNASTPYRPEAETHPLSVYGLTKRDGEQAALGAWPERTVVLRTSWVYAARGSNFVRTMLRLLAAKGEARVVSDQIGTPTSADSLARAIWAILARPTLRGIHHFTDAGVASWYDFATAIAEEAATLGLLTATASVAPITTAEYPTAARRPPFSVLDKSSLAAAGIVPVHWRKALRPVLEEIRGA